MYLCVIQDWTNVAFDFVARLTHFRILKERLPHPPVLLAVRTEIGYSVLVFVTNMN